MSKVASHAFAPGTQPLGPTGKPHDAGQMVSIDDQSVRELLSWPDLIDALRRMFVTGCTAPPRLHFEVQSPDHPGASLLLMPAWISGRYIGTKLVNIFPSNKLVSLPSVSGLYVLADGETGRMLASIEGGELTARRTAAASVLAASFLARPNATTLLVIGTGRIARNLAEAYCAMRPIERLLIYGRNSEKAAALVAELARIVSAEVAVAKDVTAAISEADIVTSATLATEPIIHGSALSPGVHVDLVGAFRPDMREADSTTLVRATSIFVDTREGALSEAGDIMQAVAEGAIGLDSIEADLGELCRGTHPGRRNSTDITLFKSVGASIEDLAAAIAVFEGHAILNKR